MSTDLDGRDASTLSAVLKYWTMSFADWFEADFGRARYTHRHRIFLEIIKHRIAYFWYKLLKLLTLERDNCEQFLESIV